jgi:hypothetical protein
MRAALPSQRFTLPAAAVRSIVKKLEEYDRGLVEIYDSNLREIGLRDGNRFK